MNLQEDIQILHRHEHFGRVVQEIQRLREETISHLQGADIDVVQQTAGKILAYDEIIRLCDWETLQKRFPQI
jgi:hypothetical protein